MKKCPFCGADIEDSARFCLYCMQPLTKKEQVLPHHRTRPQWLLTIAAVIAVALILVIVLLDQKSSLGNETPSDNPQLDSTPSTSQTEPSGTPPVTTPSHTHSYSIENAAFKYQKEAATCTTPAIFYYSCTCGEKGIATFFYGKTANHTIATDAGYPATCVNTGLTDGTHCSVCGTVLLAQTTLPVASHIFDNEQDKTCNACNYVREINCSHLETVKLSAIPSTCIASGLTEGKKCTLCQAILTTQTILAPLGHTEVIDPAIAATCTADGKTEGKHCSVCNAVLTAQVTVAAKGHTEVIDPAVAATCTTNGLTEGKHCSICQIVLVYQQHIPARGHSFDPENSAAPCSLCGILPHIHSFTEQNTAARYLKKAAECTTAARYYYSCTCGEKGDDYFFYGSATGHTVVTEPGYPPGCVTEGLTDRVYCSVCNDGFECHTPIPATGHAFSVGSSPSVCLDCGEYATLTINAPELPLVVNSFGFKKSFRIDWITYSLKPMTDGKFYIEFTFYGANISSESALFDLDVSLRGVAALSSTLCRNLAPGESGTYLAAAQIKDPNGTYTLVFN